MIGGRNTRSNKGVKRVSRTRSNKKLHGGKSLRRKSLRRKSLRRKSVGRKSLRRKSLRRKSLGRKSVRRKSVRRKRGGGAHDDHKKH